MSSSNSWQDKEDSDQEGEENDDEEVGNDHVIFLIDARSNMRAHIQHCIEVVLHVSKAKVISSNKSNIAVIFFGTKYKNTDVDGAPENIFTLFNLDTPSATRIKTLARLSRSMEEFDALIGSQEQQQGNNINNTVNLKEALWLCCQNFNAKKASARGEDFHRIWLFTNDSDPNAQNPQERAKIVTIAKDCSDSGGEISIWYFDEKNTNFDVNKFYRSILCIEQDEELQFRVIGAVDGKFTNLSYLRKKEYKKRSMASIPFQLGTDLQIAVRIFKTVHITKKPSPSWLYRPTNEQLKISSRYIDCYGSRIDPTSIKTYIELGRNRAYISTEEVKLIKFDERATGSLRLLYFTSASNLSLEMNIQGPYFIYPNEAVIKGSSALFAALLNDIYAKGLIAVAEFYRTRSSAARLVALLPQVESVDDDGVLVDSPGFNMIPLPFAVEIRQAYTPVSQSAIESTSSHSLDCAEKLVNCFQLEDSFDYTQLENPTIQKYYSVLQAIALTEEDAEWTPAMDKLQPNPVDLDAFEELFVSFKTSLGLSDVSEEGIKKATKRSSTDESAPPKKKAAVEGSLDMDVLRSLVANDSLHKKTIPELKEICKSLGLPVGGTKPVLVDRIMDTIAAG